MKITDVKAVYVDHGPGPRPFSDGGWRKLRVAASRQQSLGAGLSLVVAWNAQFSDRNLDSAERVYLGGAGGVRAYPASEGGGAQGTPDPPPVSHGDVCSTGPLYGVTALPSHFGQRTLREGL